MLSHEYKCIFVHIPKIAGQSIDHVFLRLLGLTWETRSPLLLKPNADPKLGPPTLAHLKASEYVKCGHVTQEQFDSYFKFSFIRNPWDRLVSEYKYRGLQRRFDFKTFLFKHFPKPNWTDEYRHVIPQYDFLFDEEGFQLVDFIGRFENLQNDFDEACRRLGIPQTTLPYVNKSSGDSVVSRDSRKLLAAIRRLLYGKRTVKNTLQQYTEYYDDEAKEFVENLYKKDIETFKYQFEK